MSKILKLLQISVVSGVIIFCSFSANASDNIPKLKIKSDKQKVQLEEVKKIKRVCDVQKMRLTVECSPKISCKSNPIVFEMKDSVLNIYRNSSARIPFDDFYRDPSLELGYNAASSNGEKMSFGLAYHECREKGLRLPLITELYSAYEAQKNIPHDECSFELDEYAADMFTVSSSVRQNHGTALDMNTGKSIKYNEKDLKRVRCVE